MTDPNDLTSRIFSFFIISLISINVTCIVLESIASLEARYRLIFFWIEMLSTAIFATEYILRLWTSVERGSDLNKLENSTRKRLRYVFSPLAIVDLLAFLPSLLQALFPGLDLRFLRVLRLLRVFKLTRYFSSFELLLTVLHEERKSLIRYYEARIRAGEKTKRDRRVSRIWADNFSTTASKTAETNPNPYKFLSKMN